MIEKSVLVMAGTIGLLGTALLAEHLDHPINMSIPFGPGGATDISGQLGAAVGVPLVIANVVGATGAVAAKNAKA